MSLLAKISAVLLIALGVAACSEPEPEPVPEPVIEPEPEFTGKY